MLSEENGEDASRTKLPTTSGWPKPTCDMPTARQSPFAAGGGWDGKERLDTVEIFSVKSGTWRTDR